MTQRVTKGKVRANRQNASKSTGPNNTSSTRFNAVKHGLLSEGITELDSPNFQMLVTEVKKSVQPKGPIETFLAERICLCMIRLQRACRLEAEFITSELNPPIIRKEGGYQLDDGLLKGKTIVVDPGIPALLSPSALEELVERFQRYETALENKLFRAANQLERLQRLRQGEKIPPPVSLEVGLHTGVEPLASFSNSPEPDVVR